VTLKPSRNNDTSTHYDFNIDNSLPDPRHAYFILGENKTEIDRSIAVYQGLKKDWTDTYGVFVLYFTK